MISSEQYSSLNYPSIPPFKTIVCRTFKDSKEQKHIGLLTNNLSFLKEKWSLITEYTQKIDPKAKIEDFKIIEIKNPKYIKEGFTHAVDLYEVLPRLVKELYGRHHINTFHGNCHGAALVAAGIHPIMASLSNGPSYIHNRVKKISIKELTIGDLIYLHKPRKDHSFIFLDKDISLSMNGIGESLEIHCTENILKLYGFSENIFSLSEAELKDLTIYRKNAEWTYPELIMPSLIKIYQLMDKFFDIQYPSGYKDIDLKSAAQEFNIELNKLIEASETNEKDVKETWLRMQQQIQRILPNSIVQMLASSSFASTADANKK